MSRGTRVVALGASHHTTPVEVREKLAVSTERASELYQQLRAIPGLGEILVLSTCNRLELYGVAHSADSERALEERLCEFQGLSISEFAQHRFLLHDAEAVTHLLEVASGIDSQIIGETEIFGQVKSAYAAATAQSAVGAILNRVLQKCFQAAKFIRSNTPIGEGQVSVATVTVDLTEKIFGHLGDCRVLVVGTGEVGEKTARAMFGRGVGAITVLSRFANRAQELAAAVKARAGTLDQLPALLGEHDVVIGSTTTTAPVVTSATVHGLMRTRKLRPLFFVDLGMPRNFDAALAHLDSVFLYDLDDLARIADENLASRRAAVERCRRIAREKSAQIWEGVVPRLAGETAETPATHFASRRQVV